MSQPIINDGPDWIKLSDALRILHPALPALGQHAGGRLYRWLTDGKLMARASEVIERVSPGPRNPFMPLPNKPEDKSLRRYLVFLSEEFWDNHEISEPTIWLDNEITIVRLGSRTNYYDVRVRRSDLTRNLAAYQDLVDNQISADRTPGTSLPATNVPVRPVLRAQAKDIRAWLVAEYPEKQVPRISGRVFTEARAYFEGQHSLRITRVALEAAAESVWGKRAAGKRTFN